MLQLIFAMDGVCCEKIHRIYRQGDANLLPTYPLDIWFCLQSGHYRGAISVCQYDALLGYVFIH